ncbi:hypothetical protein FQR65_LT13835 [Abscondita terminalis]|nr:hypothetical protein FQR65_LT13835 [Abscondita terminalis]
MKDEQLIEMGIQYPVIYDLSHGRYMDTTHKLDIWNKIGKQIQSDGSTCKARWNNKRDMYRKSINKTKTKSGDKAKKIKLYKHSEQLDFLKRFFDERKTKSNIEEAEQEEEHETRPEDEEDTIQAEAGDANIPEVTTEDLEDQALPSTSHMPYFRPPNTANAMEVPKRIATGKVVRKKMTLQQTASAKLMEYLINKNKNQTTTSSPHPVDAFLMGISSTL